VHGLETVNHAPINGRLAALDRVAPILIALVAAAGFLAFLPQRLAAWDAIQFALGLEDFAIPMHQPHPPGYLGHMAVGRVLTALGVACDRAIQLASLVAAAAATGAVYVLGRRLHSRAVGGLAAALFATNPVTIYYAVSGESYPIEAFGVVVLVTLGLRLGRSARLVPLAGFFLIYGFFGGIRQSIPLFLGPFALWRLIEACRASGPRGTLLRFGVAGGAAIAGILAWFVPLAFLAGGAHVVLDAFGSQFFKAWGAAYSPLLGATDRMVAANLDNLWRFLLAALAPAGWAALALAPLALRASKPLRLHLATYALWIAPPFLWFALMFVWKPGHMLFLCPAFALASAAALRRALPHGLRLLPGLAAATIVLAQIGVFLSPPAWWSHLCLCSASGIAYDEVDTAANLDAIRELTDGDPSSVLIVARASPFSFRKAMYYLPDVPVTWLMDEMSTGIAGRGLDACEAIGHRVRCLSGGGFWMKWNLPDAIDVPIPASTRRIVWLAPQAEPFMIELAKKVPLRAVKAGPVSVLPVADVGTDAIDVTVGGYRFRRE